MKVPSDPLRLFLRAGVYVVLYFLTALVFGQMLLWLGGYLAGNVGAVLFSAFAANWVAMRIYENRRVVELGLWWNRASRENFAWGLVCGIGSACLVLAPPLAVGAAHIARTPGEATTAGTVVFVLLLLAAGSGGEELFFRGYGFQIL